MPRFKGQPVINVAGGAGFCLSKLTTQPDASYHLWDFLTGPVATGIFIQGHGVTLVDPATLKSAAWRSKPYDAMGSGDGSPHERWSRPG